MPTTQKIKYSSYKHNFLTLHKLKPNHHKAPLNSPGHIHFWIYDDVTNNGVLGLQRKISIHMAFVPLLFWSLLSIP